MNAPEKITSAEPINAAHEVLMKAADAMCTQQIAAEIHGRPRPTKPQIKAVEKWLKEVHDRGMLTSQPGRGGVALYSLTTPVCDFVQTRGESQTAAPAERVLTPEAQADRDAFIAEYGRDGNCSCHISPPCNSCLHPGNPLQQDEVESCWMAAGDSEGGETDAPAVTFLAPEDYEMPPADPVLLASANRELCHQLSHIATTCAEYLPDPSDITTVRAVEIMDMLIEAQIGYIHDLYFRAEVAEITKIARGHTINQLRLEVADLRERLDAVTQQSIADTVALTEKNARLAADLVGMASERDILKAENLALKTLEGSMPGFGAEFEASRKHREEMSRVIAELQALRTSHTNAINEADRLRAELATERQAREALQEQSDAVDVKDAAVGYLVRVPKRAPILRRKPESARSAALSAVRSGAARAEVLAVVPVGTARRGAEWQSTEAGG